jgi:anti-anti-sigma factor
MSTTTEYGEPVIHEVDVTEAITALDLEGEFDIAAVPVLDEAVQKTVDAERHLIVNVSDVTFIDSATVNALFNADAAARDKGLEFVLQFGTHATVERVFSIIGVDSRLRTAPTRAEAIELIRRGSG